MEQLRKFGILCWNAKERLVLVIMVLLLGYRVYSLVINPPEPEINASIRNPKQVPDFPPEPPPRITELEAPLPITPMIRRPIFDYKPKTKRGGSSDSGLSAEDSKLKLVRFVPDGSGEYKVQIHTGASRKLFAVGDSFESYTIMEIDKDTGCVEIFSANSNQRFELCE